MEATEVYWIPLYQILEERGLEVCLVNARHFQNVPDGGTDVGDCQWLQQLHAVGLLRGSYRPARRRFARCDRCGDTGETWCRCSGACAAHAEGAGSDESADPSLLTT